ncbi:hypothetical protein [Paenibacillus paeoniae]|uniref:Uncharacterized protein n=1 Tax=Paenibacillus paeoniae TaxID=2292705 RepID=A0A371PLP5_9BACL|nr:hypothetical protein [Paenibacillus paeoniae]REK77033.1 hypothetical protein DX130_08485 [Paenibacillus paeoniae]
MSEIQRNSEFIMQQFQTWKSFALTAIMQVSMLIFICIALLMDTNLRVPLMSAAFLLSLICLLWHAIEVKRSKELIVANDQLIFNATTIQAEHITEMVLAKDKVDLYLRRKNKGLTIMRLKLKHKEQSEKLGSVILHFCSQNNVLLRHN